MLDDKSLLLTESERVVRDRMMIIQALEQTSGKVFGEGGAVAWVETHNPGITHETSGHRETETPDNL